MFLSSKTSRSSHPERARLLPWKPVCLVYSPLLRVAFKTGSVSQGTKAFRFTSSSTLRMEAPPPAGSAVPDRVPLDRDEPVVRRVLVRAHLVDARRPLLRDFVHEVVRLLDAREGFVAVAAGAQVVVQYDPVEVNVGRLLPAPTERHRRRWKNQFSKSRTA